MAKRKRMTMIVTITVPADLSAAEARREVRTLINHQSNWLSRIDEGDVKAITVKPLPKPKWSKKAPSFID